MTDKTNADLIETAKAMREQMNEEPKPGSILALWFATADALEAADQRAAGYAAVMENVRREAEAYGEQPDVMEPCGAVAQSLQWILADIPADVLRDHDAALIEGLASELNLALYEDIPHGSPIRFHYEAWLREKARQRREEQS